MDLEPDASSATARASAPCAGCGGGRPIGWSVRALGACSAGPKGRSRNRRGRSGWNHCKRRWRRLLARAQSNRPDREGGARRRSHGSSPTPTPNKRLALPDPFDPGCFWAMNKTPRDLWAARSASRFPFSTGAARKHTAIAGARGRGAIEDCRAIDLNIAKEVTTMPMSGTWKAVKALRVSSDYVMAPAQQSFGLLEEAFKAGQMDLLTLSVAERQAFERARPRRGVVQLRRRPDLTRTRRRRFSLKAHLFAAALAGMIFTGFDASASPAQTLRVAPSSEAARQIELSSIKREPVPDEIAATAIIEPECRRDIAETTSTIPARVVKLIAEPGSRLKRASR